MGTDKTEIEGIRGQDRTVREVRSDGSGAAAGVPGAGFRSEANGQFFRDWKVVRPFPAQGGEADVYLVAKVDEQRILKVFRYGIAPKQEVFAELLGLSERHPGQFVRIFEFDLDPTTNCYFEMEEYIAGGTLADGLAENRLTDDDIANVLKNLYAALCLLHNHNILHLDLKPANVLVRSRKPLEVVLSDFSISSVVEVEFSKKLTVHKGTSLYQSPENIAGVVVPKTDWWSLGIVVLELLLGKHPLDGLQPQVILYQLTTKGIDIPDEISPRWRPLLMGLLTRNPDKRWEAAELRQWFDGVAVPTFYLDEMAQAGTTAGPSSGFAAHASVKRLEKPLMLGTNTYYSLEELLTAAFSSFDDWEACKALVGRGTVESWLEENGDSERAGQLRDLVEGEPDADLLLLAIGYYFHGELPLTWRGVPISEEMLLGGLGDYDALTEPEAQMIQGLFSGHIFRQFRKLTGKSLGRIEKLLKLGEAVTSTALKELPIGQRCRIVLHAVRGEFAAGKALPAVDASLGNPLGDADVFECVAAKGFAEFAKRMSLWLPEDAAVWEFAGRILTSQWRANDTVVGFLMANQDEIVASTKRDSMLVRSLSRLLTKPDPDQTLIKDLPDLLKAHTWLEPMLRACYRLPSGPPLGECMGSLRTAAAVRARADVFKNLVVPQVIENCVQGRFVSFADQRLIRQILDNPDILIEANRFIATWKDVEGLRRFLATPPDEMATADDLRRIKIEVTELLDDSNIIVGAELLLCSYLFFFVAMCIFGRASGTVALSGVALAFSTVIFIIHVLEKFALPRSLLMALKSGPDGATAKARSPNFGSSLNVASMVVLPIAVIIGLALGLK